MNQLDKLKKALNDYLSYAEGLKDPKEAGAAVEDGWRAVNGVTKAYYRARVARVRALSALPCGHDATRTMTQKEIAEVLGITTTNVNTLVRGGWDVKPQYPKSTARAGKKK